MEIKALAYAAPHVLFAEKLIAAIQEHKFTAKLHEELGHNYFYIEILLGGIRQGKIRFTRTNYEKGICKYTIMLWPAHHDWRRAVKLPGINPENWSVEASGTYNEETIDRAVASIVRRVLNTGNLVTMNMIMAQAEYRRINAERIVAAMHSYYRDYDWRPLETRHSYRSHRQADLGSHCVTAEYYTSAWRGRDDPSAFEILPDSTLKVALTFASDNGPDWAIRFQGRMDWAENGPVYLLGDWSLNHAYMMTKNTTILSLLELAQRTATNLTTHVNRYISADRDGKPVPAVTH